MYSLQVGYTVTMYDESYEYVLHDIHSLDSTGYPNDEENCANRRDCAPLLSPQVLVAVVRKFTIFKLESFVDFQTLPGIHLRIVYTY